jgi:radical SAM protein with 4Fe4S-binding SPASM domain
MSIPRMDTELAEIQDEFVRTSKAFCMMPWIHFYVSPRGRVMPCCTARDQGRPAFGDINRQSFDEIWNGENIRRFRLKMLRDEPDEGCSGCYEMERHGGLSTRKAINKLYEDKLEWARGTGADGFSSEARPIYWDIRFSNRCNLRCRICSHFSSSAWHKDAVELGQIGRNEPIVVNGVEDADRLLEQLDRFVPYVDQIYFAGGEPLFMDEHYRLLDLLQKHGKYDVWLRYSTNFSTLAHGDRSILETWKKFRRVTLAASLDAAGDRGELQRKGLDWNRVLENRRAMIELCPHIEFIIALTVSVFSVFSTTDFHRELSESGFMDVAYLWPRVLREPEEYSVQILPRDLKASITKRFAEHIRWAEAYETSDPHRRSLMIEQLRSAVAFMNAKDRSDLIGRFRARCNALDRVRSERTADVMPELEPLLGRS